MESSAPCDVCLTVAETMMTNAVMFAIAGGMSCSVGVWLVVSGYRDQRRLLRKKPM